MMRPFLPLILVSTLLVAACDEAPQAQVNQSPSAQESAPVESPNRLLDTKPADFMLIVGDCGQVLLDNNKPDDIQNCLKDIGQRASAQGIGELTTAELASPNIALRWRFEHDKAQTK
ncbi:hypothetical protein ACTSKR_05915 [Chitinibacteraceae bacterium HSL-7]